MNVIQIKRNKLYQIFKQIAPIHESFITKLQTGTFDKLIDSYIIYYSFYLRAMKLKQNVTMLMYEEDNLEVLKNAVLLSSHGDSIDGLTITDMIKYNGTYSTDSVCLQYMLHNSFFKVDCDTIVEIVNLENYILLNKVLQSCDCTTITDKHIPVYTALYDQNEDIFHLLLFYGFTVDTKVLKMIFDQTIGEQLFVRLCKYEEKATIPWNLYILYNILIYKEDRLDVMLLMIKYKIPGVVISISNVLLYVNKSTYPQKCLKYMTDNGYKLDKKTFDNVVATGNVDLVIALCKYKDFSRHQDQHLTLYRSLCDDNVSILDVLLSFKYNINKTLVSLILKTTDLKLLKKLYLWKPGLTCTISNMVFDEMKSYRYIKKK